MNHDNQNTLTDDAVNQLSRVSAFRRGFSREGMNSTPTPGVSVPGAVSVNPPEWPVKVNGDAATYPTADVGIHQATLYMPDPEGVSTWAQFPCFARALPDSTLATGAIGLGRLIGWHALNSDPDDWRPVYVVTPVGEEKSYGDVIGPDCARTGQLAMFTDPSGRFIGPATTLRYEEDNNTAGGSGFVQNRSRFALTVVDYDEEPYPRNAPFRSARIAEWSVNTQTFRDAVDPISSRLPAGATAITDHKNSTCSIYAGFWGRMDENVNRDYSFDYAAFRPDGGLCIYYRQIAFYGQSSAYQETVWYDSVKAKPCKHVSGLFWATHCTSTGTPGISPSACFTEGLLVQQGAAIAALAGGATLPDTVTKVNEIIARLKTIGIIL